MRVRARTFLKLCSANDDSPNMAYKLAVLFLNLVIFGYRLRHEFDAQFRL